MQETSDQYKGLYVPSAESDACGVGLIADLKGKSSHYIIDSALQILENMEHRGACGCEENTGDGAGILLQIPHQFFKETIQTSVTNMPAPGKYGVGMFFFPREAEQQHYCHTIIQKYAAAYDFEIFHKRIVPSNNAMLGQTALDSEPNIVQIFFKTRAFNYKDLEKRFYFLRSSILKEIYESHPELRDDFYIASLSSKTIVYKGLLTALQLRPYFLDLQEPTFASALAIVHSRFSTNTLPKWKLAQPFRCIAHNGEINTIQGNLNWWHSREQYISKVAQDQKELSRIFPVCDPYLSDSGNFDNVVDFLQRASRSIPHAMMMMIPEAWQNNPNIEEYKKAFYQYHESLLEPWDGPAAICFTDGCVLGATLDRNGLRPLRYFTTSDDLLVLGSEAGCLNIDQSKINYKGRLEPGKMLVADLDEQRIISDKELKEIICQRKPYQEWLEQNALHINDLKTSTVEADKLPLPLKQMQIAFGMSQEDEKLILNAMMSKEKEPIGSMGADIPLAVLSKISQHLANYFKQQFAQVTNPPIDSLRENYYMSLSTLIGGGSKLIGVGPEDARTIRFDSPLIDSEQLNKLQESKLDFTQIKYVDILYTQEETLENAIERICEEAYQAILLGNKCLCLTDTAINKNLKPIPSLMIVGALHHCLIQKGLRKEATLIVKAGDIWEAHHFATLLSYGADLIYPYLALISCRNLAEQNGISTKVESTSPSVAIKNYKKAVDKALLKIMSKLGVSTLASYKGAQTFEALGISQEVVDKCFKGTVTRIEGMRFQDLQRENEVRHQAAFEYNATELPDLGNYQWKRRGEYHLFNPQSIHLLQYATQSNQYNIYQQFAATIDQLEHNNSTLRSFFKIKKGKAIPIEEVEPIENIFKRFATGAMSFGSISHEAHTTLAIAMNRIGGKSNSGEGGEDEARYPRLPNGNSQNSAIKQVASGRFGVDINYLSNAEELQIKMAQGAKPGEGGQLPGHKVNKNIARVRNATPGVGLISPPPHHDIYSIEDLAQLIFDLKNANRKARISVKLVAKTGVGVIASGVTKAHADHILISGYDGGTGASPLSSIRHAGLPWEIGLSETHQTLVKNGVRDRVVLQTDGQIRTGRDLAIATMLGAEEWGIATAALVVEGCILMRKCHLNTCPVGIATQDESLRQKFAGKVEHLINYFTFLAQHLREIMAECGVRTINEFVGRTDLLEIDQANRHWKSQNLNLQSILYQENNTRNTTLYASKLQNHGLENILDKKLLYLAERAIKAKERYSGVFSIISTDRATGTMLSNEITKRYGAKGLPIGSISIRFQGSAGQSFGAFTCKGINFALEGEANDYFGKGLSGARLSVSPFPQLDISAEDNVIIGNVALYGATAGEAYINGRAGDRFCVRNSGANVVVEGIGENGCEYMTGGTVLILGGIGKNFAAGMSGGIAYIHQEHFEEHLLNQSMVLIESPTDKDLNKIHNLLKNHCSYTASQKALRLLNNWEQTPNAFVKIIPTEYKRVLEQQATAYLKSIKAS